MKAKAARGLSLALALLLLLPLAADAQPRRDAASWIALSRARLDAGDLPGAYEAGSRALSAEPDNVEALILGGQLARRRYGLRASQEWFQEALKREPDNVAALVECAATQGDMGANQEMLATTRRLLAVDRNNRWAWYFRAVMAARAGKPALARAMLDRIGDTMDDQPGVLLLKAVLDLQRRAPELARQRLIRLVTDQPNNFAARRLLAQAQWQVGDVAGAEASLRPLLERADADSYALMLAVRLAERADDHPRAAALLDRLTNPAPISAQPLAGEGPAGAIAAALRRGDVRHASDLALSWHRASPGWPAPYLALGDVRAAEGNWAEATNAYRDAANLAFTEGTALRLAHSLTALQQAATARQTLSLYLAQNPQSVSVRLALADLDLASESWAQAIPQLEILRDRLGDGDPALLARLGWGWAGAKDKARALAYVQRAYARVPSDPRLRAQLALVSAAVGQKEAAQRLSRAALADPRL